MDATHTHSRIDHLHEQPRGGNGRHHDYMPHDYDAMIRKWLWRDFANIILGVWLITQPFTLGYRSDRMMWNDIISGGLVVILGALSIHPRFNLARWAICFIGIWLLFAPLVFWTPDAAAYNSDTLIGALLISFSVLVPMMPSRKHHVVMMLPGPDTPPGWSYNPSDWIQRGPIIAMALLGFFISRYLAAYQLGHIGWPWDPFFRDGTQKVLDSDVSRAWPISDAGLGAVSYMIEALSGFMGLRNRWRTMPWMVAMFGVLVVPLGVVSIVLVILQPVAVGHWCALCLITAGAMLIMIAPATDEVVATVQFLIAAKREGQPFWRTFWIGGTLAEATHASPSSATDQPRSRWKQIISALDLNNVPWNMLVSAALGIWIMAAPAALGSLGAAAKSDYVAGALIVTWSVIAFGEIVRPIRLLNIPMGLWLIAAPFIFDGDTAGSRWNDILVGIAIIALSFRRGSIEQRFGSWNRYLAKKGALT